MPQKENKKAKTGLMTDFVRVQTGPPAAPGSSAAKEDEEDKEEKRPNKRKCPGDPVCGESRFYAPNLGLVWLDP